MVLYTFGARLRNKNGPPKSRARARKPGSPRNIRRQNDRAGLPRQQRAFNGSHMSKGFFYTLSARDGRKAEGKLIVK